MKRFISILSLMLLVLLSGCANTGPESVAKGGFTDAFKVATDKMTAEKYCNKYAAEIDRSDCMSGSSELGDNLLGEGFTILELSVSVTKIDESIVQNEGKENEIRSYKLTYNINAKVEAQGIKSTIELEDQEQPITVKKVNKKWYIGG